MRCMRLFEPVLLLTAASLLPSAPAYAQRSFEGKQIRVIAPTSTGGTAYGHYAHLAAHHLGRFIPGNPTVVVSFMPGAGGLTAMNHLFQIAPRDGTTIAVVSQDIVTDQVRKRQGVRYDAERLGYLGRVASNVPVHMVWHAANIHSLDDIKRREVVTGAVARSTHEYLPKAQNTLLGTKWKVVTGYGGANEARLAMERGEVQAVVHPAMLFNQQLRPWLQEGRVKVVVQYADFRHPALSDVPTIVELAPSAETKRIFAFMVSFARLGRAYAAPPGLEPSTLETLRSAFDAMVRDPVFNAEADKLGVDVGPMPGAELAAYVKGIVETPPEIVKLADAAIEAN